MIGKVLFGSHYATKNTKGNKNMNNNKTIDVNQSMRFNLKGELEKRKQYYGPVKMPNAKDLILQCENTVMLHYENHCGSFLFITISLAPTPGQSLDEEWIMFKHLITMFINQLSKRYLISGAIIGVEMFAKQEKGKKGRAGRPHAHIVLFVYNDFLSPDVYDIRAALMQSQKLDLQIVSMRLGMDTTKNKDGSRRTVQKQDVVNQIRYCLKGAATKEKKPLLQPACLHYLQKPSLAIVVNTRIENNPIKPLAEYLQSKSLPMVTEALALVNLVPTVRRYDDDDNGAKLQMAEFIRAICLQEKVAFYKGILWKKPNDSFHTWVPWKNLSAFSTDVLSVAHLPTEYLQRFTRGATWALTEGYEKRLSGPLTQVFPRLTLRSDLWEFDDGQLYDLAIGQFSGTTEPFLSPGMHQRVTFQEIAFPSTAIRFLREVVESQKQLQQTLLALGGLFHEVQDRKTHKALWIQGPSASYKTWFITAFLNKNFARVHVHRIPTLGVSQFRYGRLVGETEGVLFIDDFKSQAFKEIGHLLNLLDGTPFVAEEKYKAGDLVEYKGGTAITTTQTIEQTVWAKPDRKAIQNRCHIIDFGAKKAYTKKQLAKVQEDLVALGLLCNALFLNANKQLSQVTLPKAWNKKYLGKALLEKKTKKVYLPCIYHVVTR